MIAERRCAARFVLLAVAAWFSGIRDASASFTVDSWRLTCGVNDPAHNGQSATFQTVRSPFVDAHAAAISGGSASAAYNALFDSGTFDFRTDASVVAPGSGTAGLFNSGCSGSIVITNDTTPLSVSVDSSFTWQLPAGSRDAYLSVSVRRVGAEYYYTGGGGASPDFGDPPSGTVTPQGSVVLPGIGTYALTYSMFVDAFSGNPGQLGHGDGVVHFHAAVVPEIGTLALVLCAATTYRRRHRPTNHRRNEQGASAVL